LQKARYPSQKEKPARAAKSQAGNLRKPPMNKPNTQSESPPNGKDAAGNLDKDEAASPGNVDKIRDILFGSQMRDYEKRFARFEERLLKETADLREDMKRRIASLEAYVKNEVEALSDRLKSEQTERVDAVKEAAREFKENTKGWEKKAGQLEDQAAKSQRDLRQHILEESKRLSEEIEQKHGDVSTSLKRESQELRSILADRLALADLFAEMALRLKDEFEIPGKQ
jgi:Skp family chaperone for outer membrane proteins